MELQKPQSTSRRNGCKKGGVLPRQRDLHCDESPNTSKRGSPITSEPVGHKIDSMGRSTSPRQTSVSLIIRSEVCKDWEADKEMAKMEESRTDCDQKVMVECKGNQFDNATSCQKFCYRSGVGLCRNGQNAVMEKPRNDGTRKPE